MKTLKTLLMASLAIAFSANVDAQTCYGLDENDFPQTCVSTEGTAPANATFNYDYVTGSAATGYTGGADGTDDVTVTMTATCNFPNGTNGSTYVAACLGPNGLTSGHNGANTACGGTGLAIDVAGGSDFGGATCDDQPCTVCYVEVCYDFINDYSSEAAGFDAVWSSMNGSTEGYEAIVGWVEGTDNTGAALPANGTTTAGLDTWCHADVVAGTLPVNAIFGATPPAGTFSADAITGDGVATVCPTEEPASSSGPDSGGSAAGVAGANLGLNADDILTRMCVVYVLSNNNADDCDADGETSVNTNPSGSFASVDICPPTVEVTVPCGTCTEGSAGLVITELSYDPATSQGNDGDCEYIELFNSYSNAITLDANTTLELSNGASFTFPAGTTIAPGEYIIIAINPTGFGTCTWATPPPAGTQIFGPTSGSLSNSGESVDITLACASNPAVDFTQSVAFSDGTTPTAGGQGDAVYYPLDGTGPLAGAPTPGSGDCVGCAMTEFLCEAVACAIEADLMTAPAAPTVTESTCQADGTTVDGGVIDPITCPTDATAEYSIDGGTTWVTTVPAYDQTTAVTVTVRCLCDEDMTTASPTAEVTTVPGMCTATCAIEADLMAAPAAPTVTESTCQADGTTVDGGVIDPITCPAGATAEYSTDGGATWAATVPAYDQTTAITVTVRCLCDEDMMTASPTAAVTTVPGMCMAPVCEITDLVVTPTACDPTDDTYDLDIAFTVTEPGASGMFNVDVCGTAYGPFSYATDVPLNIPDLSADGTMGCTVTVTDADNTGGGTGGTVVPTAADDVFVSFVPDGVGAGGGVDECDGESVTIHNFATDASGACVTIDISDFTLTDNVGEFYTFPAGTMIPPGGSLTLTSTQMVGPCSGTAGMGDGGGSQFSNSNDNALLSDAAGAAIDDTGLVNGDPGVEYESPALTAAGGAGSAVCGAAACEAAMPYDVPFPCMVMCPTDITATLGTDATVCSDNPATDLTVTVAGTGAAPYTVVYNDGTMDITLMMFDPAVDVISVAPMATTTYTLVSITDANGCTGTVMGTATITVNDPPNAGTAGTAMACDDSAEGTSVVDLAAALGTADVGGAWAETTASGADITDPTMVDFNGIAPGAYTFEYTVTGVAPCADATAAVTVTVMDCAAAVTCGTCTEGTAGLVITELSYDPAGTQGNDADCEYIELFNSYSNTITLDANTTLELSNGASFTFPAGTTIAPSEYVIIAINPTGFGTCTWATPPPAGTQIFGPTTGSLANAGESVDITLACATNPAVDFTQSVTFSDGTTPTAGGGGDAVYYPLDGTGPLASAPTPGSGDCVACTATEFTCESGCPTDITGMLGDDALICSDNNAVDLMVVITGTGAGPYTVTYNDGAMDIIVTGYNDGDAIPISPTATTTYTLVSITDVNGCTGTVSGEALITVNDPPNAGMAGTAMACSNAADGNTIVDLDGALTGTPDAAGVWMEATSSGVSLANTMMVDFNGVAPGMYTFTYTVPGDGICQDAMADVVVTVADCSVPCPDITADIAADATVCADNTASTLTITITGGTGPYTVMYSDGTTQTITGYNSGNPIAVSPTATTTYMLTGVMDANMCPATLGTTDATITVVDLPVAGTTTPAMACNDSAEGVSVVDLDGTLTGADAGTWSETTASGVSLADPTMVDFSGVAPGTYTFVYTVAATAPCTMDAMVSVDIMVADCAVPGCTLVLSPETAACDAETAGVDTYTVSIPFDNGAEGAPGMMGYTITTSGTLGGDNPMTTQSGVITITFNEGAAYDYSIQGTVGNANELCDFSVSGASPTCEPMVCEDEIAGMVIADSSCDLTGITVTITDAAGNVITTLTTDSAGVYDSTPAVFPCGNYFAALTAGVPACYGDGETGPKAFVIDGDTPMNDTDGPNFGMIADIPTVGEWGLIILALLMSIVAVVGIRERKANEVNA